MPFRILSSYLASYDPDVFSIFRRVAGKSEGSERFEALAAVLLPGGGVIQQGHVGPAGDFGPSLTGMLDVGLVRRLKKPTGGTRVP